MTSRNCIAALSAALLALAAAASPAAAQGTGVDCIAAQLSFEQLGSLGNRWVSQEVGPVEINEEVRPAIRTCIDKGVIVTQPQVDSSFTYLIAIIEILNYGTELQGVGIDPAGIESLWERMTPELRGKVLAYVANEADLPEEEMKIFVAANSTADENGKLGTALVFLLAVASSIDAERTFTAATPQ
jgi:hypothetical protein